MVAEGLLTASTVYATGRQSTLAFYDFDQLRQVKRKRRNVRIPADPAI
ncbi:hypothetical protein [Mesorhizobium sp. WSM4884]|nr:hypothetical protein [Mesorhizobium sp. WSM4884]MDG4881925.1 hypothetical protein [Mesorhizobium sp. WSM4884]